MNKNSKTTETNQNIHETISETYDVVVIGGGPAGMMAAGHAAERGLKVLLLEKNDGLGKKLLITGGGRCNVTNAEMNTRTLLARFKDSDKYLFSTFSQYGVRESLDFFHIHDMPTKIENEKRVFPTSNKAQSVWDVLVQYMRNGKVEVRSNMQVIEMQVEKTQEIQVEKSQDTKSQKGKKAHEAEAQKNTKDQSQKSTVETGGQKITGIKLKDGSFIYAKNFILATGGKSHPETGSTGDGFVWLKNLGHRVSEPRVALVPIKVSDKWVKDLSGFSLPEAKITLFQNGKKVSGKNSVKKGKVLFTHFGLSGPAILNMSTEIDELLKYDEVILSLDLVPKHDYGTLNTTLQKLFKKQSNKKIKNVLSEIIPNSLVSTVLEHCVIDGDIVCHSITREQRMTLIKILKGIEIHPTGLLGADKAIITSGGVSLDEIDWKTMRSRMISNLYIVGDLLDIDRPSGGYSLQLCWTTGWVAGNSVQ